MGIDKEKRAESRGSKNLGQGEAPPQIGVSLTKREIFVLQIFVAQAGRANLDVQNIRKEIIRRAVLATDELLEALK